MPREEQEDIKLMCEKLDKMLNLGDWQY